MEYCNRIKRLKLTYIEPRFTEEKCNKLLSSCRVMKIFQITQTPSACIKETKQKNLALKNYHCDSDYILYICSDRIIEPSSQNGLFY